MTQGNTFSISCPTQIHFGVGVSAAVATHLPQGTKTVFCVTGASGRAADPIMRELRRLGISIIQARCTSEPSVQSISAALDLLDGTRPDAVLACGGGSVIDTGKLIAFLLSHDLPMYDDFDRFDQELLSKPARLACVAIPTTAGTGAEVTANCVIALPAKGAKISLRGRALNPAIALVDPSLMSGAPAQVALRSGLDAVTQVIESYTSNAATPFSDGLSLPAIAKGLRALNGVIEGGDIGSWTDLAWVSLSSGIALANSGLGAAHGLAAVIGGQYDAPHGALCGRLLVPVLRCNVARAAPGSAAHDRLADCASMISHAFTPRDAKEPFSGFEAWMNAQNLPRLSDWGVHPDAFNGLARAATDASSSKKNAVALIQEDFIQILADAF